MPLAANSNLDIKSPVVQDAFQPMPGLISCTGTFTCNVNVYTYSSLTIYFV